MSFEILDPVWNEVTLLAFLCVLGIVGLMLKTFQLIGDFIHAPFLRHKRHKARRR